MQHNGATFHFGPVKMLSTATFETYFFPITKIFGLLQLICMCTFT